jgi:hypothetical protein
VAQHKKTLRVSSVIRFLSGFSPSAGTSSSFCNARMVFGDTGFRSICSLDGKTLTRNKLFPQDASKLVELWINSV